MRKKQPDTCGIPNSDTGYSTSKTKDTQLSMNNPDIKRVIDMIQVDPLMGVFKFEYGIMRVDKKMKEGSPELNLYIISCSKYMRTKMKSPLQAALLKRSIIKLFKNGIKEDENAIIMDYFSNKFIIATTLDLTPFVMELKSEVKVGATTRHPDDNLMEFFSRAENALKNVGTSKITVLTK
jgi:hypothetical protein